MGDMIWNTDTLTPEHREVVEEFDRRSKFDFNALLPGLQAQFGSERTSIPVEFTDLSRYRGAKAHFHPDDTDEKAHGLAFREQALGLAYYSGKIAIEQSISRSDQLEVLAAEGAHMIDFFWMTQEDRDAILWAAHGGVLPGGHSDWFEEGGENDYTDWVGETFMDLFIRVGTDIPLTLVLNWGHPVTEMLLAATRDRLARSFKTTPTTPATPEAGSDPEVSSQEVVAWGHTKSAVYHLYDHLQRLDPETAPLKWASEDEAVAYGRRVCRTCVKMRG